MHVPILCFILVILVLLCISGSRTGICVLQIQQFVFLDEKVVGIKLRKDDCSAFPAIYFNSPSMGQGGSSPATAEDLTNAVCTFNGQLPHVLKLFCLPLTQQKLWPAMSFWPQAAGPFLPTEVFRI